ncbi:adenylate/guanylate cyclase domain-containing protein [Synechococcus sp. CS-1328]|nr:adenylate/guanylate cyclase domain-containing protein [Synechococcus sp. CS-1328]
MLGVLLPLAASLPALRPSPVGEAVQALDAQLRATAFRLRGARPVAQRSDPVVLAIDADSLNLAQLLTPEERQTSPLWQAMGPWPWPRALQAELAAWVLERGARRVIFNVVLARPSRFGVADDQVFVRRLAPWRQRVVLAAAYVSTEQEGFERAQLQRPLPLLRQAAAPGAALTGLLQSPQGLTEAIPGRRWLEAQLADFARPWPLPLAYLGDAVEPQLPWGPRFIDFAGPSGTWPLVPAWQLPELPEGFWRDRLVLIGVTAAGLGDQMETPFGPQSGTEVQAAALASILRQTALRPLPSLAAVLLLLLWGVATISVLARSGQALRTMALAGALAAGVLVVAALLWGTVHLWLPLPGLLLMPVLGGSLRGARQWWAESRERAYLHQVLARRVSPALLRDILRDPGPLGTQVGGSRCRCVVLFTDLVGFTPLSSRLDAQALFALLNRYFEAIASAVIEEQGLLDKFIGDALMAEFGVPRSRGEATEALAAVRAALAMQQRLEALNRDLAAQEQPTLQQGIGLHVGEVIAGNLGSSQRLEFTVVGAAVNVASRLEGLTRRFPDHPILLSGELVDLLPGALDVVPLGEQMVKGWPEPVRVFGLRGLLPR